MSHALPQDSATSGYCRRIVPLPYHTSNGFLTAQTINNPYSTIGSFSYTFNEPTGDLVSRSDAMLSLTENFTYDILDRLTGAAQSGTGFLSTSQTFVYADNGNMTKKTDISAHEWNYNNYAVTGIPLPIPGGIPTLTQTATYTAFDKVKDIVEGTKKIEFLYRADEQRGRARYYTGATLNKTRFYAQNYEKTITGGTTQHLSYVMAEGKPVAMFVRTGGTTVLKYLITDYLGSITHVLTDAGLLEEERSYDAWGRMRSNLWDYATVPGYNFDRGYTAQENLFDFNVLNLNGRLYDPLIGRMFSVDPYITDPANAQTYNSYSYCHNNPLKYTDKNGNFAVVDSWLTGFVHGLFSTSKDRWSNAISTANHRAGMDLKISGGMLISDPNKSTGGQLWELISRATWQGVQTSIGLTTAHFANTFMGVVTNVDYKYGATAVQTKSTFTGVAQGSYILGTGLEADADNDLFQHEYGHYLQSQAMGLAYYTNIGIPSAGSVEETHKYHKSEQDANRRAFIYFNKQIKDYSGWDHGKNPLNIDGIAATPDLVDYKIKEHRDDLNKLELKANWQDYASWLNGPMDPVHIGLLKAIKYRK